MTTLSESVKSSTAVICKGILLFDTLEPYQGSGLGVAWGSKAATDRYSVAIELKSDKVGLSTSNDIENSTTSTETTRTRGSTVEDGEGEGGGKAVMQTCIKDISYKLCDVIPNSVNPAIAIATMIKKVIYNRTGISVTCGTSIYDSEETELEGISGEIIWSTNNRVISQTTVRTITWLARESIS